MFPSGKAGHETPKGANLQMPILPPLRTAEGIQVPDLSGLRLRFAKHADDKLTLSIGNHQCREQTENSG